MKIFILIICLLQIMQNTSAQEINSNEVSCILSRNDLDSIIVRVFSSRNGGFLYLKFKKDKVSSYIEDSKSDFKGNLCEEIITPKKNESLENYFIQCIDKFYISKDIPIYLYFRRYPLSEYMNSDPSEDEIRIYFYSNGKMKSFEMAYDNGYTNKKCRFRNFNVKYSMSFRKFIQTIDRYFAEELGGDRLEQFQKMLYRIKFDNKYTIIPNEVFENGVMEGLHRN